MKNSQTRKFDTDESTQTLEIITGETFEGTIVTEKLSVDKESGDTIMHVTLETPTLEDQVFRTLEELAEETEEESVEVQALSPEDDAELIDELTFVDPSDDALELSLKD